MRKYGNWWERVEGNRNPTTGNSWLCATIGYDQLWIDETEECMFLREGRFSPIWFKCKF